MRRRVCLVVFSVFLMLGLALPTLAKQVKTSFKIFDAVTLAGTELKPGEYRLVAEEDGKVMIYRGNQKAVEAQAKWVDGAKARKTSVLTNGGELRQIRIGGQARYLSFEQ